jgi:hypothetical protein
VKPDWVAVSGGRDDKIVYAKAIFACDRVIVTHLYVFYPESESHTYDPLLGGMEGSLRPGPC